MLDDSVVPAFVAEEIELGARGGFHVPFEKARKLPAEIERDLKVSVRRRGAFPAKPQHVGANRKFADRRLEKRVEGSVVDRDAVGAQGDGKALEGLESRKIGDGAQPVEIGIRRQFKIEGLSRLYPAD